MDKERIREQWRINLRFNGGGGKYSLATSAYTKKEDYCLSSDQNRFFWPKGGMDQWPPQRRHSAVTGF